MVEIFFCANWKEAAVTSNGANRFFNPTNITLLQTVEGKGPCVFRSLLVFHLPSKVERDVVGVTGSGLAVSLRGGGLFIKVRLH